jgi:hypothetical protein
MESSRSDSLLIPADRAGADHVRRLLHAAEMHTRKVLAHNPEREQLGSREQSHDGRQKGKARDRSALQKVSHQNVTKHTKAEQGEGEPTRLAICSGMVLKPVIMFMVCVISFRKVYPEVPWARGSWRTGVAAKRFVPQVSRTSIDTNEPT